MGAAGSGSVVVVSLDPENGVTLKQQPIFTEKE
jgi:hypothetical protein